MTLRSAVITREGGQVGETEVDGSVCDCCQTALARSGQNIIAVYRDRSAAEIRDIYRVIYNIDQERWGEPGAVSNDGWEIAGCPVNGPSVAAHGETVITAWFTAADDQPRSYMAVSSDGGLTFGAPELLQEGPSIGRVAVAFSMEGMALLTWVSTQGEKPGVQGRFWNNGSGLETRFMIGEIDGSRSSGFPRSAALARDFLVTWTRVEPDFSVVTAVVTPGVTEN
ncbi:MAG: hypothetical protein R3212_05920 [Xanthomonadales bacterium]|nr:hypothetical protein [Xanthomonadales bacterium]